MRTSAPQRFAIVLGGSLAVEDSMRSGTAIFLSLGLSAALFAQVAPANGTLLVLAKSDLTLSVVDPATLKVLGQVPSGPDPHEVIASTDGRTA